MPSARSLSQTVYDGHGSDAPRPPLPFRPPVRPLDPDTLFWLGIALVAGSLVFFILGIYCIVVSSYMPDTGYWLLDAIKYDQHYKYFIPSCIPAGLVFVIVNWGGLHYFRHA